MSRFATGIWVKHFHWNAMNNLPNDCSISVKKIHFSYNEQKEIFSDLSFSIHSGDVFGLYGNNGSGKSTLLKIISGILYPTDGSIDITVHNQLVTRDSLHRFCGYSAPYIALYDEFSLFELCRYITAIRGITFSSDTYNTMLTAAQLKNYEHQQVKYYSSGMQQRAKLILAILHEPSVLFLDEPTSNLDELGIDFVRTIVEHIKNRNGIVCIATNELREKQWCNRNLDLTNTHN